MIDTLGSKKAHEKSAKAKFADFVLGFMQIAAYFLGFIYLLQLLTSLLSSAGVESGDVGTLVWAIIIGMAVLAGWALEERKK